MKCVRNIYLYTLNVSFQVHTYNIFNLSGVKSTWEDWGNYEYFAFQEKL
jgi:hypothetical protein